MVIKTHINDNIYSINAWTKISTINIWWNLINKFSEYRNSFKKRTPVVEYKQYKISNVMYDWKNFYLKKIPNLHIDP